MGQVHYKGEKDLANCEPGILAEPAEAITSAATAPAAGRGSTCFTVYLTFGHVDCFDLVDSSFSTKKGGGANTIQNQKSESKSSQKRTTKYDFQLNSASYIVANMNLDADNNFSVFCTIHSVGLHGPTRCLVVQSIKNFRGEKDYVTQSKQKELSVKIKGIICILGDSTTIRSDSQKSKKGRGTFRNVANFAVI